MAIELDFSLSPSWNSRAREVDFSTADEGVLRYEAFLGDVGVRIDAVDFSTNWGWVPILDFAMGLETAIADLEGGEQRSVFEFTESDDAIRFVREGDLVCVSTTYRKGQPRLPFEELRAAVSAFATRVRDRVCGEWPELKRNKTIERWLEARSTG